MTRLLWTSFALVACNGDAYYDEPVVLRDDTIVIDEDAAFGFDKLEANDDGNYLSLRVASEPTRGRIDTLYGQGYAPFTGVFGVDQFTYEYADQTATVDVKIVSDGIPYERAVAADTLDAYDVESGDIDGDGLVDLVTCNAASSSITVLANRTTAPAQYAFSVHRFEGGYEPDELELGDFDGDGALDVVTSDYNTGLVVLRNAGQLRFDAPVFLTHDASNEVVTLDADGDGALELVSFAHDGTIRIYPNRSIPGTLAFGEPIELAGPDATIDAVADDFDGDGRTDLAVLSDSPGSLVIFTNTTARTEPVTFARAERATGADATSVLAVDLDRDGRRDFAVLHGGGALWIYENRAAPGEPPRFDAAEVRAVTPSETFAVADLDDDNLLDLVAGGAGQLEYVFAADGDARAVQPAIGFPGQTAPRYFGEPTAIRSVELDGVPPRELVVASAWSYQPAQSGVHVVFGR